MLLFVKRYIKREEFFLEMVRIPRDLKTTLDERVAAWDIPGATEVFQGYFTLPVPGLPFETEPLPSIPVALTYLFQQEGKEERKRVLAIKGSSEAAIQKRVDTSAEMTSTAASHAGTLLEWLGKYIAMLYEHPLVEKWPVWALHEVHYKRPPKDKEALETTIRAAVIERDIPELQQLAHHRYYGKDVSKPREKTHLYPVVLDYLLTYTPVDTVTWFVQTNRSSPSPMSRVLHALLVPGKEDTLEDHWKDGSFYCGLSSGRQGAIPEPHEQVKDVLQYLIGIVGSSNPLFVDIRKRMLPYLAEERERYKERTGPFAQTGFANLVYTASLYGRDQEIFDTLCLLLPLDATYYSTRGSASHLETALQATQTDRRLYTTWKAMLEEREDQSTFHPRPLRGDYSSGFRGIVSLPEVSDEYCSIASRDLMLDAMDIFVMKMDCDLIYSGVESTRALCLTEMLEGIALNTQRVQQWPAWAQEAVQAIKP